MNQCFSDKRKKRLLKCLVSDALTHITHKNFEWNVRKMFMRIYKYIYRIKAWPRSLGLYVMFTECVFGVNLNIGSKLHFGSLDWDLSYSIYLPAPGFGVNSRAWTLSGSAAVSGWKLHFINLENSFIVSCNSSNKMPGAGKILRLAIVSVASNVEFKLSRSFAGVRSLACSSELSAAPLTDKLQRPCQELND